MSDDNNTEPRKELTWEDTRTIWSAGGKTLPEKITEKNAKYLIDLRQAVASFSSAKIVSEFDRGRDWTFDNLAEQCRNLSDSLYKIDDVASSRTASALPVPLTPLLGETITNLDLLGSAFEHAHAPLVPRKKPHEYNYFLIVLLADIYERNMDRSATVTTDPITNQRRGDFVNFVIKFAQLVLPDDTNNLNSRAILRAVDQRRKNPEPSSNSK